MSSGIILIRYLVKAQAVCRASCGAKRPHRCHRTRDRSLGLVGATGHPVSADLLAALAGAWRRRRTSNAPRPGVPPPANRSDHRSQHSAWPARCCCGPGEPPNYFWMPTAALGTTAIENGRPRNDGYRDW